MTQKATAAIKYVVLAAIIIYIGGLLSITSGSTKSFDQIEKSVLQSLDKSELHETGQQGLKRYYGLNAADYDGVTLYVANSNMSSQELLLLKMKSDSQLQEIQDAISQRIESRKVAFEGYAPKEARLVENHELSIRGMYVFFTISPKAEEYRKVFTKSL